MIAPELPLDEAERLSELRKYQLLDSAPEAEFDHLTELMSQTFGAPIALVSLIDSHRQWFMSRQGLEACSTSREISFCGHAILKPDVFYVEDASLDPRFFDNPLVTGDPFIKTYAGAPIVSPQGFKLGTTCLIFKEVTPLSRSQLDQLANFARIAADLIEMRLDRLYYRAQKLKLQQLVAVLGHELRTPLASLKMMQDQANLSAIEPFGREIVETTEHLHAITDDIESLASGRIKSVAKSRSKLFDLVERVLISLKPLLAERGIEAQLQSDISANEEAMLDLHILRQLLTNLIKNAALHSQATNLYIELNSTATDSGNRFQLRVIDNGVGIPECDRERLFSPYERGTSQSPGTGLGLAVCRELSQRMQGSLTIEDTPGGGTTFVLEFTAESPVEIHRVAPAAIDPKAMLKDLSILLVEDTRMLRVLGETILKGVGANVAVAENGIEALAAMGNLKFDYVISDVIMPGMGGDELLHLAGEKYPDTPVIILSSVTDEAEVNRLLSLGALAVLPKPLDLSRIVQVLSSVQR